MVEYISREAVIQELAYHVRRSNNSDFAPTPTWNEAVDIVQSAPAADVVEVVRCKDCQHFAPFREFDGFCKIGGMLNEQTHYCAYGERREDGCE